jgi:cell division protein FtsI (penicillin-binding protein 3)
VVRASRVSLVHGGFVLFAVLLIGRAGKVQLLQTAQWRARANKQQVAASPLPAPRGTILDASGAVVVESRELVKLTVAPKEVFGDGKKALTAGPKRLKDLASALTTAGVPAEWVRKATDTTLKWVEIPGRWLATDVAGVTKFPGVRGSPVLERVAPGTEGLRRIVGRSDEAGEPVDGLEKSLDALLRGESGHASELKDAKGRRFDSPSIDGAAPQRGQTVVLTINQSLQGIAEQSLADAVKEMGATGGDIVLLDPMSGEIRAMASRRADPRSTVATALTEPYEPGSTLKPLTAARLLDLGRARPDEMIATHNGHWELNGRKIEDEHPKPSMSLADVIRLSSNIGIISFAQRLQPSEQYELLRDFGFGAQTGLPYPGESSGQLAIPRKWDQQTAASLAMGYAITVTPLQLATAYGAIANGGELLEPAIVKEVRRADGTVRYTHQRRVVRRVMTPETAAHVRSFLSGVVESGTAEKAKLATFDVAGKTGTAKVAVKGRYMAGRYTASFVGLFPADKPQFVILVKLDNPTKTIFGGKAAAPVSKTVLQAAIAARDASLDRAAIAPVKAVSAPAPMPANARVLEVTQVEEHPEALIRTTESGSVPFVYRLDAPAHASRAVVTAHPVPDVTGMPLRRAVYTLHRAGFRVSLASLDATGGPTGTAPVAGTIAPSGSTVRLLRAP